MPWGPAASFTRHNGHQGVWGVVLRQGDGAVRQGCARWEHGVDGFQVPVALLRVQVDPHLVVVATFQRDHWDGAGVIFALLGSCACRLSPWWVSLQHVPQVAPPVRGCLAFPVSQAIVGWDVEGVSPRLWSDRSRPPVLGAGLGSVGGAMSVCAQPRCRTLTPPWSGWWKLNHQIHVSTRSSAICIPGLTSAWNCRTAMSVDAACCSGTTAKSLFGLTSWRCLQRAATSLHGGVLEWMS